MTENRNGKVKACVTKPPSPSKQGAMTQPALINNYLHVKAPNRALADCNFSKFYGKFGVISLSYFSIRIWSAGWY